MVAIHPPVKTGGLLAVVFIKLKVNVGGAHALGNGGDYNSR